MNTIVQMMENIPFFAVFTASEKQLLAEHGHCFELFKNGEVIIQEGDTQDSSLFIILTGAAFVRKDEYPEHIIAYLETGSIIGEAAFLVGGRRRMASVVAQGLVNVFKLDQNAMEQFDCSFQLKLTKQLVVIIVERLEKMNEALAEIMG
ncbi:MAG: cyclic nucleotide-binding domain-containing protein [Magnetococcales bacterium]|nr:cyclic nucleotide-binding domain-containing protein [Magnetococcales bacterium]MBF0438402.1 cyclic nucleotide-binding domain-containing protein [Magnetococcales bacterium]